jgi:ArsR family transcriptional regulator
LGQRGRLCVGDIAAQFRISRPAISHHLKILKTNGLVQSEKVGQEVFYWVNVSHLAEMLRDMADAAAC